MPREQGESPDPEHLSAHDHARGRDATRPGTIPARGWLDVLIRVRREIGADNLSIVAAGVAFYVMLSIFPALVAAVTIYGLVADPSQVGAVVANLSGVLPPSAVSLVEDQLHSLVQSSPSTLGWGALLSVLVALWSATKGAKALLTGVNLAYDEAETRNFFKFQGISLLFTVGFIVVGTLSIGLIAVLPNLLDRLPLGPTGTVVAFVAQWLVLLGLILGALSMVYRFGPARADARWRWITLGSFIAGGLWIAASGLFSWYATRFASFNETYGALASVVVLLLWLQITFFLVLLGAELNAELEHQTAIDSTTGPPKPMGRRGAVVADTLGEVRGE
jgi:membrane protein